MQKSPFIHFLLKINKLYFILFFFVLITILGIPAKFIGSMEHPMMAEGSEIFGTSLGVYEIFVVVVLGPLLETLIFQGAVISLCRKFLKGKRFKFWLTLLLSSSLFSVSHFYSIAYILFAFLSGLGLAFGYYLSIHRRNESPVLMISLVHGMRNALAFIALMM